MEKNDFLKFLNQSPYVYKDYVSLGVKLNFKLDGADIVISRCKSGELMIQYCLHCKSSFLFVKAVSIFSKSIGKGFIT